MADYPTVKNALSIFSVQTGLDDDSARRALEQSLAQPEWRAALEQELERAVSAADVSWVDFVANDAYEIDEPEDESEARELVLGLLWPAVFPGRPPPTQC